LSSGKTSVVMIGCGGIARVHLNNLLKIQEVELKGFADVKVERAKEFASVVGKGNVYSDPLEAVRKERPEAVVISVPPFQHGFEVEIVEQGIHMFVEKPVALTAEVAERVERAVERAGVMASVGYMWRYMDLTERARKMIQENGRIAMVHGQYVVAGNFPPDHWWLRKSMGGGQVVEQSTHVFDLIRYLVGDVEQVYALFRRGILNNDPSVDVEDVSLVSLTFRNNAIGVVESTWRAVNTSSNVFVRVYASDLVVEHNGSNRRLTVFERDKMTEYRTSIDPYLEEMKAFISAIRTGDRGKILSPYTEGVKTLKVTLAAVESSAKGIPVMVQ